MVEKGTKVCNMDVVYKIGKAFKKAKMEENWTNGGIRSTVTALTAIKSNNTHLLQLRWLKMYKSVYYGCSFYILGNALKRLK